MKGYSRKGVASFLTKTKGTRVEPHAHVRIYSHHFSLENISPRAREAVVAFAHRQVQMGSVRQQGRWATVPLKVYAAATKDRSVYRFHINQLEEFKLSLVGYHLAEADLTWEKISLNTPKEVELPIKEGWEVREQQAPAIDYITLPMPDESPSRLVEAQMGFGKSFVTMYAAAKMKLLAAYLFRPAYLEKWLIDIRKTYDIELEDCITVQGSAELMALLELARTGELSAKVILISNKTFQNYLKLYAEYKDQILGMGYACTPYEFFEYLGVGMRVMDEAHLDFHLNFLIDCYSHVYRSLSLSATLISDDPFVTKMQQVAYPGPMRFKGPEFKKYVATHCVFYQLNRPEKVKYQNWSNGNYSHNVFEHSVMRDARMLENYVKLQVQLLKIYFLTKDYKEGDKAIIFCASIDFCTYLAEKLNEAFPKLSTKRYVGSLNDDYNECCIAPDIRVTTHGSAGTAVDIEGLTCVLMTLAMKSSPGSLQNFGRLRVLKDGRAPNYVFVSCSNIPKHMEYHNHRLQLLQNKADSIRVDYTNIVV